MSRHAMRSAAWFAATATVGGACAALLGARSLAAARAESASARAEHAAVAADARALARLERARALVGERPRAESDLVARVHAALHAAGLTPEALTQVSSTDAKPVSNSGASGGASGGGGATRGLALQRQHTTLTLDALRPLDLARFLEIWRSEEPLWIVRTLRLDHAASAARATGGDEQERFDAALTLENVFLAGPGRPAMKGGAP